MRKIIFRGKRVDNDEWYYGYLLQPNIISNVVSGQLQYADLFVDENTVGQYTGRKDKNGKKIFEGDILLWKYLSSSTGENMLVDYEEKFAEFVVKFKGREHGIWNEFCKTVEVIGNIHDNPELLKGYEKC